MRRNPIRATKRSRFLDKDIWSTSSVSEESDPSPVSKSNPVPTSVATSKCIQSYVEIAPKAIKSAPPGASSSKSIPVSVSSKSVPPCATKLKMAQQSGLPSTVSRKSKKFIRFRFQIDCAAAVGLDVEELVNI